MAEVELFGQPVGIGPADELSFDDVAVRVRANVAAAGVAREVGRPQASAIERGGWLRRRRRRGLGFRGRIGRDGRHFAKVSPGAERLRGDGDLEGPFSFSSGFGLFVLRS